MYYCNVTKSSLVTAERFVLQITYDSVLFDFFSCADSVFEGMRIDSEISHFISFAVQISFSKGSELTGRFLISLAV